MDDEQHARLKGAPIRPPSHGANFFLIPFGVLALYLNPGGTHTLGLLGWITVALAAALGIWVGWRNAGRYLDPNTPPPKVYRGVLPFGILGSLVLTQYAGHALDTAAFTWPLGALFASGGVGWFAHYGYHRLFPARETPGSAAQP